MVVSDGFIMYSSHMTRLLLGDQEMGFDYRQGQGFLSCTASSVALGLTQPTAQCVTGFFVRE